MTTKCLGCMAPLENAVDVCPHCGYIQSTEPKEAYHLVPGTVLKGRYLIGKTIGYGGFGVTYIGYDLVLNTKVAIKEYFPSEFATRMPGNQTLSVYSGEASMQYESGLKSFNEEAKRLAKLSEVPGVVKIYDSFSENKTGYIIMEYLDGETVKDRLSREGAIPYEDTLNIIVSVLSTLAAVHPTGIIHRDISPGNIFLTKTGEVKLIDFGAARYASATHTKSLSIILKPGYAPEEQYRSRGNQGPWTDVYAAAATMYRMLTGITPQESIERVGKDELKDPSKLGVKIPKNQENALMNALNITAETRTQSAEQFLGDLVSDTDVVRNKIIQHKKDAGKWPLWLKIVACIVPVIIIGVILFVLFNHGSVGKNADFTIVPNIMNQTEADAGAILEENDLSMLVAGTMVVDFGDSGLVQDFSPVSGTYLQRFEIVSVWLSLNESVFMPNVCLWDVDSARERIEAAGLNMRVEEVENNDYAAGIVFEQEFEEGSPLSKNTLVTVRVAKNTVVADATKTVAVPDIVGLAQNQALDKLKAAGLFGRVTSEIFDNSEAGTVLSQSNKGEEVATGSIIEISISKGKEFIYMPDTVLKTKDEAARILEEAGIKVTFDYKATNDYEENLVLVQSVEVGKKMYEGDSVVLTLSKFDYGEVPDVTGLTEQQAIAAIEKAGFKASVSSEKIHSDTIAKGSVVKQSNVGKLQKGKTILLNLSNGPTTKTATVPNVAGMALADAKMALADAKFNYSNDTVEAYSDTVPAGSVISYSPSGTQTLGTTVVCTVSKGPEFIAIPNVVGMSRADALSALRAAGFSGFIAGEDYSEEITKGSVYKYEPAGKGKKDDSIGLYISKGSQYVSMPDLSGKTEDQAIYALESIGLGADISREHSESVDRGKVSRQSVQAGQKVILGSSVNVTVSKGTAGKYVSKAELSSYSSSEFEITEIPEVRYQITTTEETSVENSSATHSLSGWTLKETVKEDHWSGWIKGTKTAVEGLVETTKKYEVTGYKYKMGCYQTTTDRGCHIKDNEDFSYYGAINYWNGGTWTSLPKSVAPGKWVTLGGISMKNVSNKTGYYVKSSDDRFYFVEKKTEVKSYVNYYRTNSPTYIHYFTKTTVSEWSGWAEERNFNEPGLSSNQTIEYQSRTEKYYVVGK